MRSVTAGVALALGLTAPVLAAPRAGRAIGFPDQLNRAEEVRKAFRFSMSEYFANAFPNDDLNPVSHSFSNDRNGWGATAFDALDTAILMGETDTMNKILNYIPTVDFTTTAVANDPISVFETTIRYLGGMLAAYDLLTGPYAHLGVDSSLVAALLSQATMLADSIKVAFDTPSGVPTGIVFLNPTRQNSGADSNDIAEIGTLPLEWTRLSDLTGNPEYAQLVKKSESYLLNTTGLPNPFPGLLGTTVSTINGTIIGGNTGGWVGGDDSFYEYLIKMYLYNSADFELNKDRWVVAVESTMEHLASHPSSRPDLTFLAAFKGQTISPISQHLSSFAGGNIILGGVLLGNKGFIDFGTDLTVSYWQTYNQTASGLGMEVFQWFDDTLPVGDDNVVPTGDDADFFNRTGFYITDAVYDLRPETLESIWYLWRATGDEQYREMAWEAFTAINRTCVTGGGYSGVNDVNERTGGGFLNFQESFFLAETLKYAYLIFGEQSSPIQFQVSGRNSWVFNTEGHPIRVRDAY